MATPKKSKKPSVDATMPKWFLNVQAGKAPGSGHPAPKAPPRSKGTNMTPEQDAHSRAFDDAQHRHDYQKHFAEAGERVAKEQEKQADRQKEELIQSLLPELKARLNKDA